MFGFLKKKQLKTDNTLVSPVTGKAAGIDQSSDQLFAEEKMGKGLVIFPQFGKLVSPVAAKVVMIATTKHAIGLKMANGLEVLIHLGIDTVNLRGVPFKLTIKEGDILNAGDEIGSMNLKQIKDAGLSDEVLVVFTDETNKVNLNSVNGIYQVGDKIGIIKINQQ